MLVDSDDLVSRNLAQYCLDHPDENGFISAYGWRWVEGSSFVRKMRNLYRTCGSCTIVNWDVSDLPDAMPADFYNQERDKYLICGNHRYIPQNLEQKGRKLAELPFPSTVYVQGTGENHSILSGNVLSWKRRCELALQVPKRKKQISEEFSF